MCKQLEVLDHNKHGYVAYCPECEALTMAFGTTLVALFEDDVRFMQERISTELKTHRNRVCPRAKAFMFRLGADRTCQLVLTYSEMEALNELLNRSLLMLQALSVINAGHD